MTRRQRIDRLNAKRKKRALPPGPITQFLCEVDALDQRWRDDVARDRDLQTEEAWWRLWSSAKPEGEK